MLRRLTRGTLIVGILAFTWYSLGSAEAQAAGAPLLVGISALLLLVLLRAATIAERRRADR